MAEMTRRKAIAIGGAAGIGGLGMYFGFIRGDGGDSDGEPDENGDGGETGEENGGDSDGEPDENGDGGEGGEEDDDDEEMDDDDGDDDEEDPVPNVSFEFAYNAFEETLTIDAEFEDGHQLNTDNLRIESADGDVSSDASDDVGQTWRGRNSVTVSGVDAGYLVELWFDDGEVEVLMAEWYYEGPDAEFTTDFTAGSGQLKAFHDGGDALPIPYLEVEGDGDLEVEFGDFYTSQQGVVTQGDWFEIENVESGEEVQLLFVTDYTTHEIAVLVGEYE